METKFLLSLFLLSVICFANCTVYYVSPYGSDRNPGTTPDKPFQTLQEAENSAHDGDTIQLLPGVFQGYLNCITWDIVNVTLVGPATILCTSSVEINEVNFHSVNINWEFTEFIGATCSYGEPISIYYASNVSFTGGRITGGIYANVVENLVLQSISFTPATNIDLYSANTLISNCHDGSGEIYANYGFLNIQNSSLPLFSLIFGDAPSLQINNTMISGIRVSYNYVPYDYHGPLGCHISNSHFGCEATGYAVMLESYNCTLTNVLMEGCVYTEYPGSAVALQNSNSTFNFVTIQNSVGDSAIFVGQYSNLTLLSGQIRNNFGNASTTGGGVNVASHGASVINNTIFENNYAYDGGAIFVSSNAHVQVINSIIRNNTAYYAGAYDCSPNSPTTALTFQNTTIVNNVSISGEGDICPASTPNAPKRKED